MRYVGLDAHLRQSTFCVLNDRRRKIVTRTVKGTWASVFYLSFSWRAQPSRALATRLYFWTRRQRNEASRFSKRVSRPCFFLVLAREFF